jgi:hypothetical protein
MYLHECQSIVTCEQYEITSWCKHHHHHHHHHHIYECRVCWKKTLIHIYVLKVDVHMNSKQDIIRKSW